MESVGIRQYLELELNSYERKLDRKLLDDLERDCRQHESYSSADSGDERAISIHVLSWLRYEVESGLEAIFDLRKRNSEFNVEYGKSVTEDQRRQQIMRYAAALGASRRQLRADWRAFMRWFGHDAVTDRFLRRHNALERRLSFALGRLGVVAAKVLRDGNPQWTEEELWQRIDLEESVKGALAYDGDARVVSAAFRGLSRALQELPVDLQETCVQETTLQFIYRSAMHARQDVWIQCEALQLLESLSPPSLAQVLGRRLVSPGKGADLFVRRRAVRLMGRNFDRLPKLTDLVAVVARDPSPFVRQGLAEALVEAPAAEATKWLRLLALDDGQPQVRAAALLASMQLLSRGDSGVFESVLRVLTDALLQEEDEFVLRVATHVAHEGVLALCVDYPNGIDAWAERVRVALDELHREADSVRVRRWAAMARERVWFEVAPDAATVREHFEALHRDSAAESATRFDTEVLDSTDEETVGRVLSVLSQDDYGCEVRRGPRRSTFFKGHRFGFRLWRFLHELRTPSPDKRQAHDHTTGRVFRGDLRVPSTILCELAETKVPGEPLWIDAEDGWRPWLPLVDDALSSLDQHVRSRTVRLYTSEGVTELTPPKTLVGRLRAYRSLTWRFREYARLRNWSGRDDGSPRVFAEALTRLGFELRIRPYRDGESPPEELDDEEALLDPSVLRFFPAVLPLTLDDVWEPIRKYFFSVYDNSLWDLALYSLAVSGLFVARHWLSNWTMQASRNRIPLVIGGWGTRGKSGTERIKAALINALGYGFVSKTTGCEAMFLYGHSYGKTREMFLFRPYDKATIWEQRAVVRLADKLGTDVFLWECMGLTPSYVKILQRNWMRDDICTITNTYPDHEDLQGPAGIDIPRVMCNFIPQGSRLYTSEDQMAPILKSAADSLDTATRQVGWLEIGLLTPDILERFPYEEHPANIALVAVMAEGIGIDRDFSLKEMADRVVPDIGVLKTYPPATMRSRRVEFTNGMSANERRGCLGNWTRLGFDQHDLETDSGVWITTVVNNRADRVPRSRVFASILVRDIAVDRHVLIGNNLDGLQGYIREAWEEHVVGLSLWRERDDGTFDDPVDTFREMLARFRLPANENQVSEFLRAMLIGQDKGLDVDRLVGSWRDPAALRSELMVRGLGDRVDGVLEALREKLDAFEEMEQLLHEIRNAGAKPRPELDAKFRVFLEKWFWRRVVVIEDYYATGNQVIQRICDETPPGLRCRALGMQNIKGTGLGFVYRWQAWDASYRACECLLSPDPTEAEQGLKDLAAIRDFGVVEEEYVREAIERARQAPGLQRESVQAELNVISTNLDGAMARVREELNASTVGGSRWFERVVSVLENLLDSGDSVRRRKQANRIYRDLIAERISQERAAVELQKLNQRQKGGWLLKRLRATQGMLARWKRFVIGKGRSR